MKNKLPLLLFFALALNLQAQTFAVYGHNNEGYRYFGVNIPTRHKRWRLNLGMIEHSSGKRLMDSGAAYDVLVIKKKKFCLKSGIGPHLFSRTRLGHKNFSTGLQFGSYVGVYLGRFFYEFTHLSNGSIRQPNSGINFHRIGFRF